MKNLASIIIVIAVVIIVEMAKHFIFKNDPKFKPIYTFSPPVLCSVGYLVLALINKSDVPSSIAAGFTLGLTCMGSYDALVTIIKGWKTKTPQQIAQEVGDILDSNKEKAK